MSTQMLGPSVPSARNPATTRSATAQIAATRRPAVVQAKAVKPQTTIHHGRLTRKSRIGSSRWMTVKSLIDPVPPMIGTPVRKLSRTHSTALLTGSWSEKSIEVGNVPDDQSLPITTASTTAATPTINSTRARSSVRSRLNARAARSGRPVVSRSSTIATATIASPALNA